MLLHFKRGVWLDWFDSPTDGWVEGEDGSVYKLSLLATSRGELDDKNIYLLGKVALSFDSVWSSFEPFVGLQPDRPFQSVIWQLKPGVSDSAPEQALRYLQNADVTDHFILFDSGTFPEEASEVVQLKSAQEHRLLWLLASRTPLLKIFDELSEFLEGLTSNTLDV